MSVEYRPMKDEPHVVARRLARLERRVAKLEGRRRECENCNGVGVVIDAAEDPLLEIACSVCGGSGRQ